MRSYYIFSLLIISQLIIFTEFVQAIEVTFRNDIRDREYNTIQISQVISASGLIAFNKTLQSGEEVLIPANPLMQFMVSRAYADHSKVYIVRCPRERKGKVTIKLIDVHLNRMSGGCSLSQFGESKPGQGIKWEK